MSFSLTSFLYSLNSRNTRTSEISSLSDLPFFPPHNIKKNSLIWTLQPVAVQIFRLFFFSQVHPHTISSEASSKCFTLCSVLLWGYKLKETLIIPEDSLSRKDFLHLLNCCKAGNLSIPELISIFYCSGGPCGLSVIFLTLKKLLATVALHIFQGRIVVGVQKIKQMMRFYIVQCYPVKLVTIKKP